MVDQPPPRGKVASLSPTRGGMEAEAWLPRAGRQERRVSLVPESENRKRTGTAGHAPGTRPPTSRRQASSVTRSVPAARAAAQATSISRSAG